LADDSKTESQAKAAQRAQEGRNAMAEYEAEAQAVRAKTERLRALRLAREAAEAAAAPKRAAPGRSRKSGKTGRSAKGASATLSAWLQEQQKGGRRT
jgi:hypothetical protein